MIKKIQNGFLSALGAAFCFAIIGILGALVYKGGASALSILIGRAFVGIILFSLTLFILDKKLFKIERKDIAKLFILSAVLAVHLILWWQALKILNNISISYALYFTFPLWVFLISIFVLKEKINKVKILCLGIGIIGVMFVVKFLPLFSFSGINFMGVGLMLLAAIGWAIFNILGQQLLTRYNPFTILFYNFLFCFIVFNLLQHPMTTLSHLTLSVIIYILIISVICTYLAYVFYYFAIKSINASNVSIILFIIPFISTLFAFIILGQTISLLQFFGMVLILLGVYLLNETYS